MVVEGPPLQCSRASTRMPVERNSVLMPLLDEHGVVHIETVVENVVRLHPVGETYLDCTLFSMTISSTETFLEEETWSGCSAFDDFNIARPAIEGAVEEGRYRSSRLRCCSCRSPACWA